MEKKICTISRMDCLTAISRWEERAVSVGDKSSRGERLAMLPEVRWHSLYLHEALMALSAAKKEAKQHRCVLLEEEAVVALRAAPTLRRAMENALSAAEGAERARCILFLEGDINAELAEAAIRAGVPVLAATGEPTAEAVALARQWHLHLLCAVRRGEVDIYSERHLWD